MSKDRIFAYARKLQGMIKRARELEASLDDGEGYRALIVDQDPAKALEIANSIRQGREVLAKHAAAVAKESRREAVADAEQLMADLTAALEQAEAAYADWRMALQNYELEARLAGDAMPADQRAQVTARIEGLKRRYEVALNVASDLVPSPGVIQL